MLDKEFGGAGSKSGCVFGYTSERASILWEYFFDD